MTKRRQKTLDTNGVKGLREPKLTARILFGHVFLGSLDEELAELAQQGVKARVELEAVILKRIEAGLWPTDDLGAAALVYFLLDRPDLWNAVFRHHWQKPPARKPGRLTVL